RLFSRRDRETAKWTLSPMLLSASEQVGHAFAAVLAVVPRRPPRRRPYRWPPESARIRAATKRDHQPVATGTAGPNRDGRTLTISRAMIHLRNGMGDVRRRHRPIVIRCLSVRVMSVLSRAGTPCRAAGRFGDFLAAGVPCGSGKDISE